jgi:hypothetical protein
MRSRTPSLPVSQAKSSTSASSPLAEGSMDDKGKALRGSKRKKTITGQFAARLTEMQESAAFRVLSLSGHRVLDRLEIELGHHAGHDNGRLPVTFDDFEEYGIHRHSIAPAIREVVALGFVEVMQEGRAGNSEWRRPALYRLTYRHQDSTQPTDEWRKVETIEVAETIATTARKASKKQNSSGEKRTKAQCGKRTTDPRILGAVSATTVSVRNPPLLSISRHGGTAEGDAARQPAPKSGQGSVATRRAAVHQLVSAALPSMPLDSLGDEAFPNKRRARQ